MKILDNIKKDKEPVFFSWSFFNEVEANIVKLSASAKITTEVPAVEYATYRGDFYGWLMYKFPSMSPEHYWITLRINGMLSPHEFNEDKNIIYSIADTAELARLLAKHKEIGVTNI
jgi:hypothetical protein